MGAGPTEASMLTEIWNAAKAAGPFGNLLLLFLLWDAMKERKKLQGERDALLERVLTTFNAGTEASKDMSRAITSFTRGRDNAGSSNVP